MFTLELTPDADDALSELERDRGRARTLKAVKKALRQLEANPRHHGLQTHAWKGQKCPHGETMWEAYAQNGTAGAYRIFFCYSPSPPAPAHTILIINITPHP